MTREGAVVTREGAVAVGGSSPAGPYAALAAVEIAAQGDLTLCASSFHVPAARRAHARGALLLTTAALAEQLGLGADRVWIEAHAAYTFARELERAPSAAPAQIAASAVVEAGALVLPGVRLGAGVRIGAGSVIGRPGFGFVPAPGGGLHPMPHLGGVVLEDGVWVGALCTIDAGVLLPTRIGIDAKLDSQVHVGHGVVLGARVRVAAQSGFAGSVRVDDDVQIGGQAGFADHVHVGQGARIAAKAGVIGDVPAGATFAGYPAVERRRWLRGHARLYARRGGS